MKTNRQANENKEANNGSNFQRKYGSVSIKKGTVSHTAKKLSP